MQVPFDDYVWSAGVTTDLVNTMPGVWRGIDQLPDRDALRAFLDEHGLGGVPAVDVAGVHAVRDRLRPLIESADADERVAGATALTGAIGHVTLDGDEWVAVLPEDGGVAEVLGVVGGLGLLAVQRHLGPERFRPCSSDTCSGVFVDTSRPGRRRYCMPGHCGNRVNVANHRARRRGAAT
ncbi:CGNR zinc finger domain-containing protein [Actinomycetospora termitidis]|uniref:CGNR zinc finger domain-containing protein n=1 Tax=Actinomycetospora termitidis TaxID=3053470 RepID=A0ABT7M7R8_9PSEU|nr:CGNR zinc finger domain-containing protein [Actinomycetospora sp. Odt1-22]MDL5156724.1 CGNR zinc finger domain-containing protein [Actinomycetospora sp. Odt1-22]